MSAREKILPKTCASAARGASAARRSLLAGSAGWADNNELVQLLFLSSNETMGTVDSSNDLAIGIREICLLKVFCIFVVN